MGTALMVIGIVLGSLIALYILAVIVLTILGFIKVSRMASEVDDEIESLRFGDNRNRGRRPRR